MKQNKFIWSNDKPFIVNVIRSVCLYSNCKDNCDCFHNCCNPHLYCKIIVKNTSQCFSGLFIWILSNHSLSFIALFI